MKSKVILLCVIVAALLAVFACAPTSQPVALEVSCDEFMEANNISKDAEVAVGDTFTVTLCSNPTTGFEWSESAQISDQTVLEQVDHATVAPENKNVVGAPGQEVWTFKALTQGTSTVSLEYGRPWEGGEKGEWTFEVTVTVN